MSPDDSSKSDPKLLTSIPDPVPGKGMKTDAKSTADPQGMGKRLPDKKGSGQVLDGKPPKTEKTKLDE